MADIHQSDIFEYLNSKQGLNYSQQEICDSLTDNDLVSFSINPSRISEIKKKKRDGYSDLAKKKDEVYKVFFAPKVHCMSSQELDGFLKALLKYVKEHGLVFKDAQGIESDTYETYVKRMLDYGLPNFSKPKNQQAPEEPATVTPTSSPVLHSQNFNAAEKFIGRQELLEEMASFLYERHTVILSGIGGIGKTYLANEYARQHQKEYKYMQCVFCSSISKSFRQMILELRFDYLDEQKWSDDEKFQRRMQLLKNSNISTLLIFDNVDELPDDTSTYNELLRDSQVHIIITTRLTGVFPEAATIPVKPLAFPEQLELFEQHLGIPVKEGDQQVVSEILEYINGHTLLIELIAKSIDKGELSYKEMLGCLRSGADSEELPTVSVSKDYHGRQDKLWHFVKKILFSIDPLTSQQRKALGLLSLIPTDGISRRLFFELAPKQKDTFLQLESKNWSIKERKESGNIIRLHPVIREVIRGEIPPTCKECHLFLEQLCGILSSSDASNCADDLCKLIPSIADTIDFVSEPTERNLHFLCEMANYCQINYRYQIALNLYQCALVLWKKGDTQQFSPEVPYELYTRIGKLFQRLAKYSDAINSFKRSIEFTEEGSITRAQSYRLLGEVYRKDSKYEPALKYDQLALNIFTEISDIAEAKNAVGVVYLNMGDAETAPEKKKEYYNSAREYYETALRLWEQCSAPKRQLAFSNHNIGTVLHRLGEYEAAIEYHKKGLQIREENDLEKTDISASFVWLGKDHIALSLYDNAKDYIEKSLTIRKEILGEDHPDYAWSLDSLSEWYEKTGDIEKSIETMKRVIIIRKNALGPDHQYTRQAIAKYDALHH